MKTEIETNNFPKAAQVNLEFIKKLRETHGYTLSEMAVMLGMKGAEKYGRRESGEYNFKATEIALVAKIFNTEQEKFFVFSL